MSAEIRGLSEQLELSEAEVTKEVHRIRVRRYKDQFTELRSARGIASLVGLAILLVIITSWQPISEVLGVSWRAVSVAMAPQIAIMVIATWAAQRYGVLSRAHRLLECVESVVTTSVGAGLIWAAGHVSVPLWFIPAAQVSFASTHDLHRALERTLTCTTYGLILPLAFALRGDRASAGLALFLGMTLMLVQHTRLAAFQQASEAEARTNLMRERMQQLLLREERARIARDLHDGLGAELSSILWQVQALAPSGPDDPHRAELLTQLRATMGELRRMVGELKHPDATVRAFAGAIEQRCRTLCRGRAELVVRARGEGRIAGEVCAQLDMMIREAVRNALQHGAAQQIEIALTVAEELMIEVRDDGSGVPAHALEVSDGGLTHLRSRALSLGGACEILATPPGTSVRIRLPARVLRGAPSPAPFPMAMG